MFNAIFREKNHRFKDPGCTDITLSVARFLRCSRGRTHRASSGYTIPCIPTPSSFDCSMAASTNGCAIVLVRVRLDRENVFRISERAEEKSDVATWNGRLRDAMSCVDWMQSTIRSYAQSVRRTHNACHLLPSLRRPGRPLRLIKSGDIRAKRNSVEQREKGKNVFHACVKTPTQATSLARLHAVDVDAIPRIQMT